MPHQVCHAHCPDEGSSLAVIAAAVACVALASAIGAYIGEILWTAGIIVSVLLVVSVAVLVHVLRRDRPVITGRAAVRSLAEVAELRLVSVGDASAPAMDGHYQRAITQRGGRPPDAGREHGRGQPTASANFADRIRERSPKVVKV